jgi:hypothetical protein
MENCRLISLSDINATILNPILENQTQQHINRIIYHKKCCLLQKYKVSLTFEKTHTYVHQKTFSWIFTSAIFIKSTSKLPKTYPQLNG